jgi:1-acyl-sn-glycerol-3-phosphate acyltransferase
MGRRVVDFRPRNVSGSASSEGGTAAPASADARRARRSRRRATIAEAAARAAGAIDAGKPRDAAIASEARQMVDAEAPTRKLRAGPERFAERLRALEREIDDALARVGGTADRGLMTLARSTAEEVIAFYADLGRAFMRGGPEEVFIFLRMLGTADAVDEFGYDPGFAARLAPALRFLYDRWWRIEVDGIEHVPITGRVLLVANHSGGVFPYDALMLAHAVREHHPAGGRAVRPLIEDFVYRFPFLGPPLARTGVVRASAENAARLLAGEQAVAVFPEGAKGLGKYYRERYRLQRFARGGFVRLAMRTGAPLVPVAIIGAEEIHPLIAKWQWLARLLGLPYFPVTPTFPWLGVLGLVPLPTKWRIVFAPPLDLAGEHGPGAHEDDLLVNRLKEQIRERIQRMVVDGLRQRDSVFT